MKEFGSTVVPLIVGVFVMQIPSGIVGGIRGGVMTAMASGGADPSTVQLINLGTTPILMLVGVLAQAFMLGGIMSFSLKAARGQKPDFGEVFRGGRYFGAMFVGAILQLLGFYIGLALCVVPGVIWMLGLMFYPIMIVDRGVGGVDALKQSWEMAKGQKMNLFVFALLMGLVGIVGIIACCVGVFVAAPIGTIGLAFIYMRLNGEQPRPFGAS